MSWVCETCGELSDCSRRRLKRVEERHRQMENFAKVNLEVVSREWWHVSVPTEKECVGMHVGDFMKLL